MGADRRQYRALVIKIKYPGVSNYVPVYFISLSGAWVPTGANTEPLLLKLNILGFRIMCLGILRHAWVFLYVGIGG